MMPLLPVSLELILLLVMCNFRNSFTIIGIVLIVLKDIIVLKPISLLLLVLLDIIVKGARLLRYSAPKDPIVLKNQKLLLHARQENIQN